MLPAVTEKHGTAARSGSRIESKSAPVSTEDKRGANAVVSYSKKMTENRRNHMVSKRKPKCRAERMVPFGRHNQTSKELSDFRSDVG
jgi:hypothetical protein